MLSKTKKIVILCSMLALLVVTGVLNVVLNRKPVSDTSAQGQAAYSEFFSGYRATRVSTRAHIVDNLDSIIKNPASSAETIAEAQKMKMALADELNKEMVLEGIIRGMGFPDCVIALSTENLNCMVKSTALSNEDANRIYARLSLEAGKSKKIIISGVA